MSEEETGRTLELERYFAVLPSYRSLYRQITYEYEGVVSDSVDNPYHSGNEAPLSHAELTDFLNQNGLLEEAVPKGHPAERF